MRKLFVLLLLLPLLASCTKATETPPAPDPIPLTEATFLGEFLTGVTAENPVVSLFFTEGYGFSTAEFETDDPDEIAAVLAAAADVMVLEDSGMDITDWYPTLVLTRADGVCCTLRFDGRWLSIGRANHNLSGDDPLWTLLDSLIDAHSTTP